MEYLNPEDLTRIVSDTSTLSLVIVNEYQVRTCTYYRSKPRLLNLTFNIYEYLEKYKYDIIIVGRTTGDNAILFIHKKNLIDNFLAILKDDPRPLKITIEGIIQYYCATEQIDIILNIFSELKDYLFEKNLYIIFKILAELGFDIINNDEDRLLVLLNT